MPSLTIEQLALISGTKPNDNMRSVLLSLVKYGAMSGLDRPHRLAQFLAQLMEESGNFRYDREVWGPTAAQKRYDTRTDLGNTPAKDGDGEKNAGEGPMQITGGYNIARLYDWCVKQGLNPPDFRKNPDLIHSDPWEGLSAIWYWTVGNPTGKSLNVYADENNIEQITKKVNGGLTHFDRRIANYVRAALVLAGYGPTAVLAFQTAAQKAGLLPADEPGKPTQLDGDPGPKTRSALHMTLVGMDGARSEDSTAVKAAPVTQDVEVEKPVPVPVPVAPAGAEKRTGLWTSGLAGIGTAIASIYAAIAGLPLGVKVGIGVVTILAIGFMLFRGEVIVRRVKAIMAEIG